MMPVFPRTARALLALSGVVGLTACGGSTASLGDQPTLSGQIEGWNKGAGYTLQATAIDDALMIGTAPIDAAGNFSIALAGKDVLSGHLVPTMPSSQMSGNSPGCTGGVTFDPMTYSVGLLRLRAVSSSSKFTVDHIGPVNSAVLTGVSYVFVEVDENQSGSVECMTPQMFPATTSYDVHLKPGWNRQISVVTSGPALLDIRNSTEVPEGLRWYLH